MNLDELKGRALQIATEAHRGQVDKSSKTYVFHPIRVAYRCKTTEEKIVALLHDTIEDTYVTPEYLIGEGFPQYIVDAVLSVTKVPGESYDEFVERAAKNPIGIKVKLHDLEDNMDITRLTFIDEKLHQILNKYLKAYHHLNALIDDNHNV